MFCILFLTLVFAWSCYVSPCLVWL